jgi:hypothetical protein
MPLLLFQLFRHELCAKIRECKSARHLQQQEGFTTARCFNRTPISAILTRNVMLPSVERNSSN